jgi:hypothetical protein
VSIFQFLKSATSKGLLSSLDNPLQIKQHDLIFQYAVSKEMDTDLLLHDCRIFVLDF